MSDEPRFCECDDLGCDREHEPMPPGSQRAFDGKIAIQKLSAKYAPRVMEGMKFGASSVLWSLAHEAYSEGIEAGRALERQEAQND